MSKAEELADKLLTMQQSGLWYRSQDAAAELRRLSAINVELLEALTGFVDHGTCFDEIDMAKARAAIAKAQGEQT